MRVVTQQHSVLREVVGAPTVETFKVMLDGSEQPALVVGHRITESQNVGGWKGPLWVI